MKKVTVLFLVAIMFGALCLFIVRNYQTAIQSKQQELIAHIEELESLKKENDRLASQLSATGSSKILSEQQLRELLRLRAANHALKMEKAEREAVVNVPHTNSSQVAASPHPVSEAQALPQDSWSFVGFSSPTNAFQSIMWAMKNGDIGAYLDSLTPEAQETMLKMFSGKSEREIAEILQNEVQALKALRLDRVRDVSDASVSFVLFSEESDDGTVRTRNEAVATFTNIGGIWKSTGLY